MHHLLLGRKRVVRNVKETIDMRSFKLLAALLIFALHPEALASSNRILDAQFMTNGSATLTFPSITDTLLGRTTTDTLTNKSLSGASNTFTAIPVGAIGNGSVLSGSNTGDVTASAFGSTPNANGFSLTGQALNLQPADATHPGGISISDWNTFNGKQPAGSYITALTGDATASGPGSSALTFATVNGSVGSFTNANITVNAKGLITAASNGSATAPSLNGGSGSPESVTAGGGVTLSSIGYTNFVWVAGGGGPVTVTKTPSITACTADGQTLKVIGTDATNTVTLQDQANLASSGMSLNGNWVGAKDSSLSLHCDITQGLWVEDARR